MLYILLLMGRKILFRVLFGNTGKPTNRSRGNKVNTVTLKTQEAPYLRHLAALQLARVPHPQ